MVKYILQLSDTAYLDRGRSDMQCDVALGVMVLVFMYRVQHMYVQCAVYIVGP